MLASLALCETVAIPSTFLDFTAVHHALKGIRNGSGALAIKPRNADVNIRIGAMVASELYDLNVLSMELSDIHYVQLCKGIEFSIKMAERVSFPD